jgi:alpha-1,6-mannosyltransferase
MFKVLELLLLLMFFFAVFFCRLLWPEGIVLFFNTVQNRSSEWGVMPFHWYFTNAIPKVSSRFCE